jgi:hypothetical protein
MDMGICMGICMGMEMDIDRDAYTGTGTDTDSDINVACIVDEVTLSVDFVFEVYTVKPVSAFNDHKN